MRAKLIGGLVALGAVSAIALAFSSSFRPAEAPQMIRAATMDIAAPQNKFGFAEAMNPVSAPPAVAAQAAAADATAAAEEAAAALDIPKSDIPRGIEPGSLVSGLPRIAYTYNYAYRLGTDEIAGVQRRHADLCERQGPRVCRILALEQGGDEGDYARGTLVLAVASDRARGFGSELARSVEAAGGKEVGASISGEDLSKQIVDTQARLRARTLLRDRLMEVLATRRGTVAELVEAERGVAQVNEEIDEARSWLTEMQGRVEFSRLTIAYSATVPSEGGFAAPVRSTLGSLGSILGTMLAMAIVLATVLVPVGLVVWGGRKLWLRYRPVPVAAAEG